MAKERFHANDIRDWKMSAKGRLIAPGSEVKKNKFNAQKVHDPETGKWVDSKEEMKHRTEYRAMAKAGEIRAYVPHPEFYFDMGKRGIETFTPDHMLIHLDGSLEVIDTKSPPTAKDSRFKKLWKICQKEYPDIKWRIRMK